MAQKERDLITTHLAALTPDQRRFRINAGMAWTGQVTRINATDVIIRNARPFHGAPAGFPDTVGFDSVVITSGMVGQRVAIFCGEEYKTGRQQLSREQKLFRAMAERLGAVFRVIHG
jgi:hypothetical protein